MIHQMPPLRRVLLFDKPWLREGLSVTYVVFWLLLAQLP